MIDVKISFEVIFCVTGVYIKADETESGKAVQRRTQFRSLSDSQNSKILEKNIALEIGQSMRRTQSRV